MAIKFNHVTNTISFTSGACSASFVDSSTTGVFETTGYARNCYVTTGQTGNFVTASQTGCFITTGQTGAFGGGGGGTSLPNGTTENSALCWNGSAWVAAETYVATGQTGNFSPYNLNFDNFNVTYKCNSNLIFDSTGSAILQGSGNRIESGLYSQINNGCNNLIRSGCHNYIENGFCNCISGLNNIFSSILNGCCNRITSNSCQVGILNGFCNCISSGVASVIVGACCSLVCGAQASSVIGGSFNQNCFSSRSIIVGGGNNFTCASSTDSAIFAGNGNAIIGAVNSTVIGGNANRLCHSAAPFLQTGNVIINGFCSRICGCSNTSYNTIINSISGCIFSGSCNTLINGTNSCLISGTSSSLIIGACNVICNLTSAVVIGSGITANASNTLFVSNLRSAGIISGSSICGTGNFITTSQTGAFAPAAGTGIFVTTGQTGSFGGGGTTLPNGTSADSALCWNGSAWTTGQTYVATGATGNFITASQTGNFISTGAGYLNIASVAELITICNIGSNNLINFDIISGSTLYNTANSVGKSYLNLRGNASCSFNSLIPLNRTLTVSFLNTNGTTAYELTGFSIDGTAQTVRWANGTGGFPSGNASLIDAYSITTIKTGNALYVVYGSMACLKS